MTATASSVAALGIAAYAAFFKKQLPVPSVSEITETVAKELKPHFEELKEGQTALKNSLNETLDKLPEKTVNKFFNKFVEICDEIAK
ncbi:MAG: hypothetical protein WCK67_07640 [bacterium]